MWRVSLFASYGDVMRKCSHFLCSFDLIWTHEIPSKVNKLEDFVQFTCSQLSFTEGALSKIEMLTKALKLKHSQFAKIWNREKLQISMLLSHNSQSLFLMQLWGGYIVVSWNQTAIQPCTNSLTQRDFVVLISAFRPPKRCIWNVSQRNIWLDTRNI